MCKTHIFSLYSCLKKWNWNRFQHLTVVVILFLAFFSLILSYFYTNERFVIAESLRKKVALKVYHNDQLKLYIVLGFFFLVLPVTIISENNTIYFDRYYYLSRVTHNFYEKEDSLTIPDTSCLEISICNIICFLKWKGLKDQSSARVNMYTLTLKQRIYLFGLTPND